MRVFKRMKNFVNEFSKEKPVSLEEAIGSISRFPKVKFDETVEMHIHLNLNLKANDQGIRGTVLLPHGTGKKITVAAFCKGEQEQIARDAGAEHVGNTDLIDKVSKGFMDFDVVVAAPDMMRDLSKLGKILGPRGLMPTPKAGTVTNDIAKAIKDVKAGKIEIKSDKQAGVHVGFGKRSFDANKLIENAKLVIETVDHLKPNTVKGNLIKSISISTSMGPGVRVLV